MHISMITFSLINKTSVANMVAFQPLIIVNPSLNATHNMQLMTLKISQKYATLVIIPTIANMLIYATYNILIMILTISTSIIKNASSNSSTHMQQI